ncbi:MAG: YihY/virulence factor BrkB family protein, partial [Paracoccaceae bacterium]
MTPPEGTIAPSRPRRLRDFRRADWWAVAKGVSNGIGENELTLIAAGVAFYGFLALFPLIAALVALYGIMENPAEVGRQLSAAGEFAPPGAWDAVEGQIREIASAGRTRLGYASLVSLALALWTARASVGAIVRGLNIVYRVPEKRGFVSDTLVAYAMTLAVVLVALVSLIAVVILPGVLAIFPVGSATEIAVRLGRWPILFAAMLFVLGLLYRYGPAEPRPYMTWVSTGAIAALVLWFLGSGAFSFYVRHFASYNETYGSLVTWTVKRPSQVVARRVQAGAARDAQRPPSGWRSGARGPYPDPSRRLPVSPRARHRSAPRGRPATP